MRKGNSVVNKIKQNGVKYTIHALQELNISPNHFHLPDRTSWVPFLLGQRRISLAPGNRTTVNVKPCTCCVVCHCGPFLLSSHDFFRIHNDKLQTNKTTGGRDNLTWYRPDYVVGLNRFMDTQTPPYLSELYG